MTLSIEAPNIALLGKMGTGKSTIAQLLVELYGYSKMTWAKPIRDLAELAYGRIDKGQGYEVELTDGQRAIRTGREILQRIGTDAIRENVDQQFWIRTGTNLIEAYPSVTWVNDDTRFPNEADALWRRGWYLVRLDLPDDLRRERLHTDHGPIDEDTLNHPSEEFIDCIPVHFSLWNTGSPIETTETILRTIATATLQEIHQ